MQYLRTNLYILITKPRTSKLLVLYIDLMRTKNTTLSILGIYLPCIVLGSRIARDPLVCHSSSPYTSHGLKAGTGTPWPRFRWFPLGASAASHPQRATRAPKDATPLPVSGMIAGETGPPSCRLTPTGRPIPREKKTWVPTSASFNSQPIAPCYASSG